MKRLLIAMALLLPSALRAQGAVSLGELVQGLGVSARVLMIGAHPDDEDTQLIAWLARGRHVETAYLSLTRGDGGQNLIGNELGEALGAIRTEELLAARRLDGGRQYFTRAFDFGFSKSAEETYKHWPHDSLLNDVVTVIRAFRPHVIVAVFSGTPRDGHGHHQVSGLLAREAYDLAADSIRFPSGKFGPPWVPGKFYRGAWIDPKAATLTVNAGEYSPLRGRSFSELAMESRSQHKSQGQGVLQQKGSRPAYLRLEASRVSAVDAKEVSLFEGIDTSWTRFGTGAQWQALRDAFRDADAALDVRAPSRAVPSLLRVYGLLNAITPSRNADLDASLDVARRRTEQAIREARGIAIEALAQREVVEIAKPFPVRVSVYNRGTDSISFVPRGLTGHAGDRPRVMVPPGENWSYVDSAVITAATQPWWLTALRVGDLYRVPVRQWNEDALTLLDGRPMAMLAFDFEAARTDVPIEYRFVDPVRGEVRHPVAVAPAVSVLLNETSMLVPARQPLERAIHVTLRSASAETLTVRVSPSLPAGLRVDSTERAVFLRPGSTQAIDFTVRGTLPPGDHALTVRAMANGQTYASGYRLIDYEHIRPQRLYRPSTVMIRAAPVTIPRALTVAYIQGVGDNVAPALQQLGVPVTIVDPSKIASTDFSKFSAVLVGPRAYEASEALRASNARLLDFARNGGTLVVQYGQFEMATPGLLPFPITHARPADRVTEEDAPVRVLDPSSPLLAYPNRITAEDWSGWVQERSLYMPRTFDPRYKPLLSMNDPGESPNEGAILATPLGRGMFVYTTLSLFRQLPAGVPGGARLIVNLLAATQDARQPTP